jgi:hypothetical protein
MPNVIKSATTVSNGTIKRNNFLLGINTSLEYGPTDNGVVIPAIDVTSTRTFFWNGITPSVSGYTVYVQKQSGGPSIFVATGDTQLITLAIQNGGTNISTVSDALSYFNGQSNYLVTNIDYPNIVTSGLTYLNDYGFVPSYPRTGTTVNDLSGNNYSSNTTGSPIYSSSFGGGLLLGQNQTVDTSAVVSLSGRITVCAWLRLSAVTGVQRFVSVIGPGELAVIRHDGLSYANGTFHFYITTGGTLKMITVASQVVVNTNSYFCGTWDGTTQRAYKNGSQIGTPTTPGGTMTNTTTASVTSGGGGTEPLRGTMFTVQVYNRALSAAEILQNYNAQSSRY